MDASGALSGSGNERKRLCIITGFSGAGKTTALRAFEDMGFFAIDGLPAALAPEIAEMLSRPAMCNYKGMALCMDMRESGFLEGFHTALGELPASGLDISVLFLEATDSELMKRYASTRRPHPLEKQGLSLEAAITWERGHLDQLRDTADVIVDSSNYSVHDLRRAIHKLYAPKGRSPRQPRIHIFSFGYKYGIPQDADYVFDLRFLPNPYFDEELRPLSGLDKRVADFVLGLDATKRFVRKLGDLFGYILPLMEKEGRYRITVAFGCTGGRHRSVAVAVKFAAELEKDGYLATLEHRNLRDDPHLDAVANH